MNYAKSFALVVCALVIIAGEFGGPAPVLGVDCPHPAVSAVTATPTSLIGGSLDYNVTINFGGAIPQGCQHFLLPDRSPAGAAANPFFCTSFLGDGTGQTRCTVPSQVVDATQNITLSFQARQSQTGAFVGNPVSTTVTNTPVALHSFTVSGTSLSQGQTITGTVLLETIVKSSTHGSARVNLSANPSSAVQIPSSIQITCCALEDGHAKGTFNITPRPVTQDTQVVISASRPNQTAITRTITVRPGIPSLSVSDVSVNEPLNRSQAVTANFTFTLSSTNPAGASVFFTMSDQNATRSPTKVCEESGSADYVIKGGRLDFGPTELTKTVSVPICHDTRNESNETFQISLSSEVGLTVTDRVVIGTIIDND